MPSAPPLPNAPPAPRRATPRPRSRVREPRGPASVAAFALTLAGCWIIAVTAQRITAGDSSPRMRTPGPAERIVYVAPEEPLPALVPPGAAVAPPSGAAPSPRATRAAGTTGAPPWPAPTPSDSTAGTPARADVPARLPRAAVPPPGQVFRGPVGAPMCLPPCGLTPTVGLGRLAPPLDAAQRDSALQVVRGAVRTAPRERGRAPVATGPSTLGSPPPMMPGVAVPLPGGGPSAEQRRRDGAANAAALARLRRVRERADSLTAYRLDSLERLAPRRP